MAMETFYQWHMYILCYKTFNTMLYKFILLNCNQNKMSWLYIFIILICNQKKMPYLVIIKLK